MALLGKLTRSKVILAPRSGIILSDIEKSTLFRNFVIFVLRNVDIVICQASFWQDKLMTISKSKNINKFKIIENWIEVEQYLKLPTVKKDKNELTRILFLSWLDRNKGVYELIESVRILIAQGLNIELILAGRGADFDDVNLLIDHLKLSHYIKAKGWVLGDEKLKLFNDSDVFVLPSYYEGYPNSLIEAMASAKCCIATKVGAIPNIIDNGVNGLTIDPVNIVQLTDAIRKVTEEPDLRYRFGIQARADVLQKNTCDVAVSKFLDLLE
jgi:glycosyltransferase involved in cell wall biosynthesis